MVEEPLKGQLGFRDMPKGEPLEEILSQANLWANEPADLRCFPISLMSFTSTSRKWFSRKSQTWESTQAEPRACISKRASFRFFSRTRWLPRCPGFYLFILGQLLHVLEEGAAAALVLHLQEKLSALQPLLSQPQKKCPLPHPPPPSHILAVEIEAKREVGVGGPQMHVDHEVVGNLHLSVIILTNLGAHG